MDTNFEEGFGTSSGAELEELRKALEIGYQVDPTGQGPDALRVESLESTLKLLTYNASHMKLWNMIGKVSAFSTVEEFNRLLEYGSTGGGFVGSGILPEEEDSTYERANELVKYVGSTRSVHHPATMVNSVPADIISQETSNGALWMMRKINEGLYYADSANNSLEWNGLPAQINAGQAVDDQIDIDLKDQPLDEDSIENAAQQIIDNYGFPSQLFSNPKVFTDFGKQFNNSGQTTVQRMAQPAFAAGNAGVMEGNTIGVPISGYNTLSGLIGFQADTFVKRGTVVPSAATSSKAPNAPTIAPGSEGAEAGSRFETADAGNYQYQVTAVNRFGESLPSTQSANVALTGNNVNGVDIVITDQGGAFEATYYRIYRTKVGATTTYYTNATAPRTGAATTWTDINHWRPQTTIGLMLDMSPNSFTFKQLSPMIKMPLAQISPAIRWMQLLYGTPVVYAPKKNVVFRNIGVV